MASCDNEKEVNEAQNLGWNVFYVHDNDLSLKQSSIACASNNLDKHCFSCMMCHGRLSKRSRPIIVTEKLHGASNTLAAARLSRGA